MTKFQAAIDLGDGIIAKLLPHDDIELILSCGTTILVTSAEDASQESLLEHVRDSHASGEPFCIDEFSGWGKPCKTAGPWWQECEGEWHEVRHDIVLIPEGEEFGGLCGGCKNVEAEQDRADDRERNQGL